MTLLIPLGLLGLLSVVALIVIYIVKPNYQHKEVTSTYVWKLSLKYRKRRLPSSKLRNIFLIVCQVLFLVAGALIMSQPIVRDDKGVFDTEVIAVIDASASMRTKNDGGVTRFERAVDQVSELANDTVTKGGYVSVILSDGNDRFLVQKAGMAARATLNDKLKELVSNQDNLACAYGTNDFNDAMTLSEEVVKNNPTASIYLYTDTTFAYVPSEGVTVVNVAEEGEWNVGILNAYTRFEEGYYTFFVEVGCYGGVARNVDISVSINGAEGNDSNDRPSVESGRGVSYLAKNVTLTDNSEKTVVFRNFKISEKDYETENTLVVPVGNESGKYNSTRVFAYNDVYISVDGGDSFPLDDSFSLFGGRKRQLKVEYVTAKRRDTFTGMLGYLRDQKYADTWEIVVDEVDLTSPAAAPVTEGYDFYIFDKFVPTQLPRDGVVFLYNPNPDSLPAGLMKKDAGTKTYQKPMYLAKTGDHAILKNTDASKVYARRLTQADADENAYKTLWSVDGNPALLINDGEKQKVIVSLFDFEWSNFELRNDFPFFMFNIFETFMPATVKSHTFEVGQEIAVNARGYGLEVLDSERNPVMPTITNLPSAIALTAPGTYAFSYYDYFDHLIPDENIFVKIPSAESNISAFGITLKPIYREKADEENYQDLMVYLAAAMLALLFTEWFLQTQEAL